MNKFLVLIFFISSFVNAQTRIGYCVDIGGEEIELFNDLNKDYENGYSVFSNGSHNYINGKYYTKNGKKISGLICKNENSGKIWFKKNDAVDKETIWATECQSYVIGVDSFISIPCFQTEEFALVLDIAGNYTFLQHTLVINLGNGKNTVFSFYVYDNFKKELIHLPIGLINNKEKLKQIATTLDASNIILKQLISSDYFNVLNFTIYDFIKVFKYSSKCFYKEFIYYDKQMTETNNKSLAKYYGKVDTIQNNIFSISNYDSNHVLISKGNFYSLYPLKKTKEFIWYYPTGNKRILEYYEKNKCIKRISYFNNGKVNRINTFKGNKRIYEEVNDVNSVNLLDKTGIGMEQFYDSINQRTIYRIYKNFYLKESYFINNNNEKIFFTCDKNIFTSTDFFLNNETFLKYTENMLENNVNDFLLMRWLINENGLISEFSIQKGLSDECNKQALLLSEYIKKETSFWPAKNNKEKVKNEIIIPIKYNRFSYNPLFYK